MKDLGELVAIGLQVVGLAAIIVFLLKLLVGLATRQSELSDIDERIKKSLREELSTEKTQRASEREFAVQRENVLRSERERVSEDLAQMGEFRDRAVVAIGAMAVAADSAIGFVGEQLRKIRAEEAQLITVGTDNFRKALASALARIAGERSKEERRKLILDAARSIAHEHAKAMAECVRVERDAASLARFAASLAPLALEESRGKLPTDNPWELLNLASTKFFDDEGPLAEDGTVRRLLLGMPISGPE